MGNKGFAITGIIYTLFILFLMILLTVLAGLSSYQRLMINSIISLEDSFEGEKISELELDNIKNSKKAMYLGKYIFKIDVNGDDVNDLECSAYLQKGTDFREFNTAKSFSEKVSKLSPRDCSEYNVNMTLVEVYSFEGEESEKD